MTATPSISTVRARTQRHSGRGKDFGAGIVLLLVALPLNLGVALASGVPAEYGIVSGAIGSLITGVLSGSSLQVSGPDAGIGVLVLEMINSFGLRHLGPIVCVAGLIQLIVSLLRSSRWFRAVSPAVVNGMLAGMGLLIIVTQFHIMLDDSPKGNGLSNLILIPAAILKGFVASDLHAQHNMAAFIGSLTILVTLAWTRFAPQRLKIVPAALVSIAAATGLTAMLHLPIQCVTLPAEIGSSLRPFNFSGILEVFSTQALLLSSLTLAFVASAQSLITLSATDSMSKRSHSSYDRELFAQGIGNVLCGLCGVLPIAGVLVRSIANIQCGAQTRLANMLHGALMIVFIMLAPGLLQQMPTSALAAVLVFIGCRMVAGIVNSVKSYERGELLIFAGTVVAIMMTNLCTGVIIGFGLALARLMYIVLHLQIDLETNHTSNHVTVHLRGPATFLHLPKLASVLDAVPANHELHIRLDDVSYVDHACLELLLTWERRRKNAHAQLIIDWGPLAGDLEPAHLSSVRYQPRLSAVPIYRRHHRTRAN